MAVFSLSVGPHLSSLLALLEFTSLSRTRAEDPTALLTVSRGPLWVPRDHPHVLSLVPLCLKARKGERSLGETRCSCSESSYRGRALSPARDYLSPLPWAIARY